MSGTPTRDWLAGTIRHAWREDCGDCLVGRWACPAHAAEAVCEAVRQERLFIMPQEDADGLYADVQLRATAVGRREIQRMVRAEVGRLDAAPEMVSSAWVQDRFRHIAWYGCPGPHVTGRTCVHEVACMPDDHHR